MGKRPGPEWKFPLGFVFPITCSAFCTRVYNMLGEYIETGFSLFRDRGRKICCIALRTSAQYLTCSLCFNPIFHGPGHMWPGFFECLQLKNFLSKKNLKKLYSWRSVFSIFFASGLSPYDDAFLTYSAKRKQKSENAGHMRPGPWKSCYIIYVFLIQSIHFLLQ